MSPGAKALLLSRGVNPYTIPNQSFQWSTRGYPSSSTYILDGTNLLQLTSDRSGNSATNCLVLNGVTGNYASFTALTAFGTGNFSVSAKVRVASLAASNTIIAGAANSYSLKLTTGGNAQTSKTGVGVWAASTGSVVVFQEAVIGYTRSGTNGIYYINGIASGTVTDDFDYTIGCSEVGSTTGGTANVFNGTIKWARVYTAALNATQMAADAAGIIQANNTFAANFSLPAKLATSFTESSSNAATVTINSTGDLGARICGERDLYQATTGKRFTTSVINGYLRALGDGIDDYCASPSFQLAQPCTIYGVMDMATWTNGDILFDGRVNDTAQLFQDTTTPNVSVYAGATGPTTTQFPVATKCVLAIGLSGANSYIGINRNGVITGNAGTATPNGITLMARAAGTLNGNCGFYELIGFNGLHSADFSLKVRSALMRTNGL